MFGQHQGDNSGSSGRSSSGYQGRGGGRGRGRGRGGGRSSGPHTPQPGLAADGSTAEAACYDCCRNFATSGGKCNFGDRCRFKHIIAMVASIPAHKASLKSVAMLDMPEGPKLLSGSSDATVKVWNLASQPPSEEVSIPTTGRVEHIEVSGSTIMWSVDEPLSQELPDNTVGMVYLFNTADGTTIPVKRSEEFPYTHPFGEVRSFKIAVMDGVTFVITAGGEGLIRTWRFDAAKNAFEQIMVLEGHIRAVTCVFLHETHLWSGSMDSTLRVWDLSSGKCMGVLSALNGGGGHVDAVTCLEYMPPDAGSQNPMAQQAYVASGGADGAVKLWSTTGTPVHSCMHTSMVTTMKTFKDSNGGVQTLLVGLLEGSVVVRSGVSMKILFIVDHSWLPSKAIWSIVDLGRSCFCTGSDDGNLVVWRVTVALEDKA